MKYISKSLRELCGNNIDKAKFSEHLKSKKSETINLIDKYIKKGEMVRYDYPREGFAWCVHKSAFDIVIRDLEKDRAEDSDKWRRFKIDALEIKLEDQTIIQKEVSDEQSDDMMWSGVAYHSMRFLDGDEPDPRKGLN